MIHQKKDIIIDDLVIEDRNLWSQVVIKQTYCDTCKSGDTITMKKGKQINKLIKALNKFNYTGLSDKRKSQAVKGTSSVSPRGSE